MRFGEIMNDSMWGTQRVIGKFLWFPLTIDFQTRWLEKVKIKQICTHSNKEYSASGYVWENYAWVDKDNS